MRWTGLVLLVFSLCSPLPAAHLGMGLRVGEVTQTSAIVWTRITATAERNHEGFREPKKRQPKQKKYVPSAVDVAKRQGEISGAAGQLRLSWRREQASFTSTLASRRTRARHPTGPIATVRSMI